MRFIYGEDHLEFTHHTFIIAFDLGVSAVWAEDQVCRLVQQLFPGSRQGPMFDINADKRVELIKLFD